MVRLPNRHACLRLATAGTIRTCLCAASPACVLSTVAAANAAVACASASNRCKLVCQPDPWSARTRFRWASRALSGNPVTLCAVPSITPFRARDVHVLQTSCNWTGRHRCRKHSFGAGYRQNPNKTSQLCSRRPMLTPRLCSAPLAYRDKTWGCNVRIIVAEGAPQAAVSRRGRHSSLQRRGETPLQPLRVP